VLEKPLSFQGYRKSSKVTFHENRSLRNTHRTVEHEHEHEDEHEHEHDF